MNQSGGEGCPGAESCRETRGKPLNRYASRPEEEVCAGCAFLPTKPEAVPENLIEFVAVALDLYSVQRSGGSFNYPDALSIAEWACLRGLKNGQDKAESLKHERERKDEQLKKRKAELGQ